MFLPPHPSATRPPAFPHTGAAWRPAYSTLPPPFLRYTPVPTAPYVPYSGRFATLPPRACAFTTLPLCPSHTSHPDTFPCIPNTDGTWFGDRQAGRCRSPTAWRFPFWFAATPLNHQVYPTTEPPHIPHILPHTLTLQQHLAPPHPHPQPHTCLPIHHTALSRTAFCFRDWVVVAWARRTGTRCSCCHAGLLVLHTPATQLLHTHTRYPTAPLPALRTMRRHNIRQATRPTAFALAVT